MTSGASIPTPPLLAVHSVDEFVFSVPDLEAARQFYASFGLDVRDEDGGLALTPSAIHALGPHPAGGGTQAAVVAQPGHPRGDAPRFAEHQQGIARITAPAGADDGGIWITGPDACRYCRAASRRRRRRQDPASALRQCRPPAQPRAFSRCTCRTSCCSAPMWRGPRASMWTCSACACRTRPATIAFLRSPHGSDHHLIALAKSGGLGLHQLVRGLAGRRGPGHGTDERGGPWRGLGRRPPRAGLQLLRVRDPWGSYAEYSTTSISSRPARHATTAARGRAVRLGAGPARTSSHEQDG